MKLASKRIQHIYSFAFKLVVVDHVEKSKLIYRQA